MMGTSLLATWYELRKMRQSYDALAANEAVQNRKIRRLEHHSGIEDTAA